LAFKENSFLSSAISNACYSPTTVWA
jgi:hypothetical protein